MIRFHLVLLAVIFPSVYSKCSHYYQSSSPSSTKRPFDICYHSEIDYDLQKTSYRYYCIESTESDYGNNSVGGYTAFREDFNEIDCMGTPNQTRIVSTPYRILCDNTKEEEQESSCEILRVRQHPIVNASACTYNHSVYAEDIEVIAICDDNGATSKAIFCNKKSGDGDGVGSYFWTNTYLYGQCDNDRLFEASYQFHGCQGDGSTYLQILACDYNFQGIANQVEPFGDTVFVAGFVLLLLAILCIVFILVWYCCWFRKGFMGSREKGAHGRGHAVGAASMDFDGDDMDMDDMDDGNAQINDQTNTMR